MPDISALYPKPPEQTSNMLSGDPLRLLGAVGQINALQRFQSEQGALGAYRDALNPDGSIDPNALTANLRKNGVTWGGPEMVSNALAQRGQQITNDTHSFSLWAAQNDTANAAIASLAGKKNPTMDDVNNTLNGIGRLNDRNAVPSTVLDSVRRRVQSDADGVSGGVRKLQAQVAGASAAMGQVPGPPNPVTGQPQTVTSGAAAYNYGSGGMATGLAPGQEEALKSPSNAQSQLRQSVVDSPQQLANLDQLSELSSGAASGPTADMEKRAGALALRLGLPGLTLNKDQQAMSEEYAKVGGQLAVQQANAGHASDAFLQNAYLTNPNLAMSKLGRSIVTSTLKGNIDFNRIKDQEWSRYANGEIDGQRHMANEFYDWSRQFNNSVHDFGPRPFQFMRMSAPEQRLFLQGMSNQQQVQFERSLQAYQRKGWLGGQQ